MRNISYGCYKLGISSYDQSNWFKTERKYNPTFARINYSSAQGTMRRLDRAFASFFDRVKAGQKPGYPRFKNDDGFNSFLFPSHGDGIRFNDKKKRVYVQNVGFVKVKNHRDVAGEVKTLSVKRECGKWFLILSCESEDVVVPRSTNPPIGIDVGLEHFLTTSDGEHVANPRFLKKALPKLRRANRKLARAKKGSKRRKKTKGRLKAVHAKIANQRRDFAHKLSRNLVGRFGLIAAEGLRVGNMLKNRRLARSISDAAWTASLEAIRYKAPEAGAEFVEVNPRGTSQDCSGCDATVRKELSERWHRCPKCGLSLHRDVNAARNILRRALARTGPTNANLVLQHGYSLQLSVPPRGRSRSPRL
jgi:putative transposase